MRTAWIGALLALLLPACGGASAALETAALQGNVYELDGQTLDRSGVSVTLLETGATYLTDANGEFGFDGLTPGVYTLDFDTVLTTANLLGEGGEEEHGDRPHDEAVEDEEGRPKVEVPEDGGEIDVRVKIEDGEVTDFSVGHHEERHAIAWLEPLVADGLRLEGKIRLTAEGDRYELAVCVWGLEHGDVITVWIGDRDLIADPVANAEGEACFERAVESVANLFGRAVHIRLGDELVLAGEVPALPAEKPPPREDEEPAGEDDAKDDADGHEEGGEDKDGPEEPDGGDATDGTDRHEEGADDEEPDGGDATDGTDRHEEGADDKEPDGGDATDGTSEEGDAASD
ncbi:MAG: carboxypeptidase-like regulatory domain-containing protein [Planctomycetota bacterium]|jgi:hypothetical protein